jgi:hypothetical protein
MAATHNIKASRVSEVIEMTGVAGDRPMSPPSRQPTHAWRATQVRRYGRTDLVQIAFAPAESAWSCPHRER